MGHQRVLHTVSVSRSAGREGALQGKWLHLASLDREGMMCGSIWGTTGFISLKQICAFKHQWNANKLNTISVSAPYQYYPFCRSHLKGRQLRVTLTPENQLALDSCRSRRARHSLPASPHCTSHPPYSEMTGEPPAAPLAPEELISGAWIPPLAQLLAPASSRADFGMTMHRPQHSPLCWRGMHEESGVWATLVTWQLGLQQLDLLSTLENMGC